MREKIGRDGRLCETGDRGRRLALGDRRPGKTVGSVRQETGRDGRLCERGDRERRSALGDRRSGETVGSVREETGRDANMVRAETGRQSGWLMTHGWNAGGNPENTATLLGLENGLRPTLRFVELFSSFRERSKVRCMSLFNSYNFFNATIL